MLFCKDYREQVAAEVGSAAPNVVSKALGEKWGQTTDRHTWEKQAEKDKARYDKEMAAYRKAAKAKEERNMNKCLVRVLRRLRFPPCQGGGIAEVTYPWIFKSGGG